LVVPEVAQQSVTKIISPTIMNLLTPKARAKREPFVHQTGLSRTTSWLSPI
jgi:hypothetical protein